MKTSDDQRIRDTIADLSDRLALLPAIELGAGDMLVQRRNHRVAADELADYLCETYGARIKKNAHDNRIRMHGVSSTCTSGTAGLLRNWLIAARRRVPTTAAAVAALLIGAQTVPADAGGYVAPVVEYVITAPEVAATARTLTICQASAEACALILAGLLAAAAADGGGGGARQIDPDPLPTGTVPLPAGAVLLGTALLGLGAVGRRRIAR